MYLFFSSSHFVLTLRTFKKEKIKLRRSLVGCLASQKERNDVIGNLLKLLLCFYCASTLRNGSLRARGWPECTRTCIMGAGGKGLVSSGRQTQTTGQTFPTFMSLRIQKNSSQQDPGSSMGLVWSSLSGRFVVQ